MKDRVNHYFAALIIIAAGAAAGWYIYHLATTDTLQTNFGGTEANYAPLQQSILKQ